MTLGESFDKKLNMLIEKYGKKENSKINNNDQDVSNSKVNDLDINIDNFIEEKDEKEKEEDDREREEDEGEKEGEDEDNELIINTESENVEDVNKDEFYKSNYYFHYEKSENTLKEQLQIDLSKQKGKYLYTIIFYDEEMITNFSEINSDSDLKDDPSTITLEALYYYINDMRIKYKEEKNHNDSIKRILDFTEELFEDKYNKMQEMIDKDKIDFDSLWYYYDKIDKIYNVKHFNEDICFKYECFYFSENINSGKSLILSGNIICPKNTLLKICHFDYEISSFVGTKSLESFEIKEVNIEEEDDFYNYGKKILNLYKKMEHMHIEGKQYYKNGNNIIYCEKNERVMVDYEGMEKYGNIPYIFYNEKIINEDEILENKALLKTLFPFVSIYNLGMNKLWGVTHIKNLKEIVYKEDAFDYLVLDETKKLIIKSLINNINKTNYVDFISGKGKGLIFLLYGLPGTGKTLTVEATCEYLKRPLFTLNVGDFGTDPTDMESIFDKELNLAQRWNAIVLIDEVDIFIEEREAGSILTNAMVCIFLRLLEYLQGIIFLTTNRLNSIDPAVKSRIDLMISYQKLNKLSRYKIWTSLFNKLKIEIDENTIDKLSGYDLNGREIRNYMKIILAIHEEMKQNVTGESILKVLKDCINLSEEFNESIFSEKKGSIYL